MYRGYTDAGVLSLKWRQQTQKLMFDAEVRLVVLRREHSSVLEISRAGFSLFSFSFRMKALYSFHCLYCLSVSSDRASNAALGRILLGLFSGIKITEHTEYQFPKEKTLCYSENRIADVTKIKVMRPRKSEYAIVPTKDRRKLPREHDYRLFCLFPTNRYSVCSVSSAIGSRIDGTLFRSFLNQNRSQKNTVTVYSVYSHSSPKRTRP